VLSIASDAADLIVVSTIAGEVRINGLSPVSGAVAAALVRSIRIVGGPGDNLVDLAGVVPSEFPTLTRIEVSGGAGTDTLRTSDLDKTLTLTGLDQGQISGPSLWPVTAFSFADIDTLWGGDGADTFQIDPAGALSGQIRGGLGHDRITYEDFNGPVGVTLDASDLVGFSGASSALGRGFHGIDSLEGSSDLDTLTGLDADSLWTLALFQTYESGTRLLEFTGFEQLRGGLESDIFLLTGDDVGTITATLFGGEGDDSFILASATLLIGSLDGGPGRDLLDYAAFETSIGIRLIGADVNGYSGAEPTSLAGAGSFTGIDRVIGTDASNGPDALIGLDLTSTWSLGGLSIYRAGSWTDLEFSAFESLQGGVGVDLFELLAPSAASLRGGPGDDRFHSPVEGLTLSGTVDGQAGQDALSYDGRILPVLVDLAIESATGISGTLRGVENVTGGAGDDEIKGDASDNVLRGGLGVDRLADGPGIDLLDGGAGDDHYDLHAGSPGLDIVEDMAGSDTLDFSSSPSGISLEIDSSAEQVLSTGNRLRLDGQFENFVGSIYRDSLVARPLGITRFLDGGAPDSAPGDALFLDALAQSPTVTSSTFSVAGFGVITFTRWESHVVFNDAPPTPVEVNLNLSLAPVPPSIFLGTDVTYTYTITNLGADDATSVVFICSPPQSSTLLSVSMSPGGSIATLGPALEIRYSSLADGQSATITLAFRPTVRGQLTSSAMVLGQQGDSNPSNNSVTSTIVAEAVADLVVALDASSDPARVGQPLTYIVTVTNRGPSPASSVGLVVEEQTFSGPLPSSRRFEVEIGSIEAGGSRTVTFQLLPSTAGHLTINATVSSVADEPTPLDNTATRQIAIVDAPAPPVPSAPRIIEITRTALPRRPRRITIRFSEPMDPTSVTDLRNYRIITSGRDRRFYTPDDRTIRPRRAVYDPVGRTLTLAIRPRARWPRRIELTIGGPGTPGVRSAAGEALVGSPIAQSGQAYVARFSRRRLVEDSVRL
jgi:uncharacterized repeat protein (TIGR01451 family)